jgi:hypothetical protein
MENDQSLVQGVEVWVPRGEVLVAASGAYGPHGEFNELSARLAFRRGEGLPGAVWSTERALLWRDLGVHFVRAELATSAGIDTAIGVPIQRGRDVIAVVVFLLTLRARSPGCMELWDEDEDLAVLRHAGGHYSGCAEFESFSQLIQFPAGTGLPGGTWAAGVPLILPDVRRANTFIRAGLAAKVGLQLGVGIPVRRRRRVRQVLTLIAAGQQPFLRALELWAVHANGLGLEASELAQEGGEPAEEGTDKLAAAVRELGLPRVESSAGISLGLPVYGDDELRKILCMRF